MNKTPDESCPPLSAIVLGATGLVGSELVILLASDARFNRVTTITRRVIDYSSNKVANVDVDFDRLERYGDSFHGDVIFSCLGTTKKQAGSISAQREVDYGYQFKAAMLASQNKVRKLVLVSSSGADASSLNPYLRMKGELEDAVSNLGFKSIEIVQPSLLLGDRPENQMLRLGELMGSKILPAICRLPGLKRYRPIRAIDVAARMIELAVEHRPGIHKVSLEDVFPDTKKSVS